MKPGAAALVGIPAVLGVLVGTALQQRIPVQRLSLRLRAAARGRRGPAARMTIALVIADRRRSAACSPGLFGVGGGILFVPTLALVLGLTQLHAEASSLLAILPTALVGIWRQQRYGNVDLRAAAVIGVASIAGVQGGRVVAESLPEARPAAALRRAPARSPRRRSSGGRGADREHFRR